MANSILVDSESKMDKPDQLKISDISSRIKSTNPVDITIYQVLHEHGAQTRAGLIKLTGIARSTIFDCLLRLMLKGHVKKSAPLMGGPGRPKVYFELEG